MTKIDQKIWISILKWERIPLIFFICIATLLWYFSFGVKSALFLLPSLVVCTLVYFFPILFRIVRILSIIFIVLSIVFFYLLCLLVVQDILLAFLSIMVIFYILFSWWSQQRVKNNLCSIHCLYKIGIFSLGALFFIALSIIEISGYREIEKITKKAKELQLPLNLQELKKVCGQNDSQEAKNTGSMMLTFSQILKNSYQKWLKEISEQKPDSVWTSIKNSVRESLLIKKGILPLPENQVLSKTEWEDIKKFLDSTEKIHKMLREALLFGEIRIPLEFPIAEVGMMEMKISHLYDIRNCMNYFALYADYYCEVKKEKEFLDALDSMIKVANIPAKEPFLISNLVKLALQKMVLKRIEKASHIFSNSLKIETLKSWQEKIAPWCDFSKYFLDIAGTSEFIWVYHTAQQSRWDFILKKEGMHNFFLPAGYYLFAPIGWTKLDLAYMMDFQIQKLEESKEEKSIRKILEQEKTEEEISFFYPLTRMVLPAWNKIFEKNFELLTLARCTWIALESSISKKQGKDPKEKLESLLKGHSFHTINPFTGEKLTYTKQGNTYFIQGITKIRQNGKVEEKLISIEIAP